MLDAGARSRRRPAPAVDAALGPRTDRPRPAGRGRRPRRRPASRPSAGTRLAIGDNLARDCAASDQRLHRTLARIDAHIEATGIAAPRDLAAWRQPLHPSGDSRGLDLAAEGIRSVVWATGYRRDYGWLQVPVLDAAGEIAHAGGVTAAPGLYVLGLRFLRRRDSNFIDGVGRDAEALAPAIAGFLGARLAA